MVDTLKMAVMCGHRQFVTYQIGYNDGVRRMKTVALSIPMEDILSMAEMYDRRRLVIV